uniref:Uncharacterized protein n=1 Tax=Arundo donax TaxID=35708 RepID=A0A0A8YMU2_ARUDO
MYTYIAKGDETDRPTDGRPTAPGRQSRRRMNCRRSHDGSPLRTAFWRISTTFLWELEWMDGTKVGLAAGLYSGKRRPDLYRTPQALQSVLGPRGPARHCGVLSIWQCVHLRTAPCGRARSPPSS